MDALYGVKKRGKYLAKYQNKRAEWTQAMDAAWKTRDPEMAKGFAGLTKGSVIKITMMEEPVKT